MTQLLHVKRGGVRVELPVPPVEIADEVERWAREHGKHARLAFVPTLLRGKRPVEGTWVVKLSLKPDDPRMKLYQEGRVAEPPTEDIWLHVPDDTRRLGYRPLNLTDLGVSGVRTFLERGDTTTGRGEYRSLEEMVTKVDQDNEAYRRRFRAHQREANRYERREERRWRFKLPLIPVAIELGRHGQSRPAAVRTPGPTSTKEQ